MGYITSFDMNRLIQDVSLQQIISGNTSLRDKAITTAIEEIKSYLRAKFDIDKEYTDTLKYSPIVTYKATDRVYLDADTYSNSTTYSVNALVLYNGNVYKCTTAVATPENFDTGKWELLGAQYDIFYAVYPNPVFDLYKTYEKEDVIYWNNKTYTCKISTASLSHEDFIQYKNTSDIPPANYFPDDAANGSKYWIDNGAYTVPEDSILDDDYFISGDNRNQQLLIYTLDCAIYHMYRRIPPSIVPEIRILAYQTAMSWLNKVAKGEEVVPNLIKLQPLQGQRIRYGSRPKQENFY